MFLQKDISGAWSEASSESTPLDGMTNIFVYDAVTRTFNVTNSPARWWQFGNGSVDFANNAMSIFFPHNPWPTGSPVQLSGQIYGTACPNISVVWDNGSVWCMRAADGKCYGLPQQPNISDIHTVHVVQACHLDVG